MNKNKSILFFLPNIYPCYTGGMEVYNHSLVMGSNSSQLKLLTTCKTIEYENKFIINDRLFLMRRFGMGNISITVSLFFYLLFNSKKHDFIYTSYTSNCGYLGYTLVLMKFLFKLPYVLHHHGGGMKPWKPYWLHKILFKNANKIFAVSQDIKVEYEKRSGREIEILLPLIKFEPSSKSKDELRKKLKISDSSKVILFVGSIKPLKSPETLLKAFLNLGNDFITSNSVKLIFAGRGPSSNSLKEIVAAENLSENVIFTGLVSREDVPDYYRIADIYVIPSHFEGTPLSLLEAFANGLACVGTNVNGIKQVIKNGENGILVEKDDYLTLSKVLKELILTDELSAKLAKNAFASYTESYDFSKYLDEFYLKIRPNGNN